MSSVRWNIAVSPDTKPFACSSPLRGGGRKGDLSSVAQRPLRTGTSRLQLDELRRISRYPKLKAVLPNHRIGTMINNLDRAIVLDHLPELPDGVAASDPNDDFLLATVLASDADFLVTGDRSAGLLQRGSFQRARILNPGAFCAELGLSSQKP